MQSLVDEFGARGIEVQWQAPAHGGAAHYIRSRNARRVQLNPKLRHCPRVFARETLAHELAHDEVGPDERKAWIAAAARLIQPEHIAEAVEDGAVTAERLAYVAEVTVDLARLYLEEMNRLMMRRGI